MDSQPETIVLEIFTNLNTRFMVVPLRSGTIGDVGDTIESFHMDLFPEWGEVEVIAMEDARQFRLAARLPIRHLFWNVPSAVIHAELIPSATNAIKLPRLNIASATGANVVSNHGIDERGSPSAAEERQVKAECTAVDVRTPATENICDDRGNLVLKHAKPEIRVFTDSQSVRETMLVVEPTTRPASCGRPENGEELQLREVSLPEPSSTPERRVSSGGSPNTNGVFEGCEEVKTRSREIERLESGKSSGSPSGGSSDETSAQNEDEDKVPELPGDYKSSSSIGSSAESEGEEWSKPVSPRKSSVGKDSDQTSSDGDSSQPSTVGSESENLESSSDGTEDSDQTPPIGRKVDFTTPKADKGAARSIGRRSLGGSKHRKYQQLPASQNGSDELINISQQKSVVRSGSEQELKPPADSQHSLAPLSLADDSNAENLLQDNKDGKFEELEVAEALKAHDKDLEAAKTREVAEEVKIQEDPLISDEQVITTSEAVEKKKDTKPTQENVTVRRSVRQKEKRTAVSVQDVRKGEDRLQGRSGPPTSVKLGEGTDCREELIPSGEGVTENGLEPGEEPATQGRSGYSQKTREALQLARMSATHGVDSNVETPSKERTIRKKGIASPVEAAAITQSRTVHEESIQQKEPHIRGESVDLLPAGDDQRLEDQIVAVADGLGKVLPSSESTQGIKKMGSASPDENQIDVAGKVASDADVKKQRKRSHKVCQSNTEVSQQDIGGCKRSEPSQGLDRPNNLNDEANNNVRSVKTPKKRKLATDHVAIENVMLVLQPDVVPESLNDTREGTEEKKAGRLDSKWVCTICDSTSYTKKRSLIRHLLRVHKLERDNIPNEVHQ